jgi:MerR family transcriptional regulator, light-induced transcriptional regulator
MGKRIMNLQTKAAINKQGSEPPASGQAAYRASAAGRVAMNEQYLHRSYLRDQETATEELQASAVLEVLTQQVIPQLVLSETPTQAPLARVKPRQGCSLGTQPPEADARFPDLQAAAKTLAEMAMDNNAGGCWQLIHDLRREEDLSPEAVMLGLIQPAARCMGEGWMTDRCDFAGVTIGLWRLQQILNDLRLEVQKTAPQTAACVLEPDQPIPSIALATLPGSQHRLGLQMVNSFFARGGWDCFMLESKSEIDLLGEIHRLSPDVVGLSVASEKDISRVARFIQRLRDIKLKQTPLVMLGGPALVAFPELAEQAKADLLVGDADLAVEKAVSMLRSRLNQSGPSKTITNS